MTSGHEMQFAIVLFIHDFCVFACNLYEFRRNIYIQHVEASIGLYCISNM